MKKKIDLSKLHNTFATFHAEQDVIIVFANLQNSPNISGAAGLALYIQCKNKTKNKCRSSII